MSLPAAECSAGAARCDPCVQRLRPRPAIKGEERRRRLKLGPTLDRRTTQAMRDGSTRGRGWGFPFGADRRPASAGEKSTGFGVSLPLSARPL